MDSYSTTTPPAKITQEHDLVMIDLGDHVKVTRAAFLTLIAFIVVSIAIAFVVPVWGPITGLILLIIGMILAYNVNCVQVGHCYAWGWILAVFYLIYAAFMLIKLFSIDRESLKNLTTQLSAKTASATKNSFKSASKSVTRSAKW